MRPLRVLAAGSLRHVWPNISAALAECYPAGIETVFGPAGLLRQRIERGEPCDLFASANLEHPQALQHAGLASDVGVFCHNRLCLSVRDDVVSPDNSWLDLLRTPALRIAISTPGSDPGGDYAWALFDHIERHDCALGKRLKQRALMLVGGEHSSPVPPGMLAAAWIIASRQAEAFIGYQSYAALLNQMPGIVTMEIDERWQQRADYGYALCHIAARPLAEFLLSVAGQTLLRQQGFIGVSPDVTRI